MQQIQPVELKAWLSDAARQKPLLLDVREQWEFETCHIDGAQLVPMNTIPERHSEFAADQDIVVVCHHGGRSQQVAMFLEGKSFTRIFNLQGGVNAWATQVDPAMPKY